MNILFSQSSHDASFIWLNSSRSDSLPLIVMDKLSTRVCVSFSIYPSPQFDFPQLTDFQLKCSFLFFFGTDVFKSLPLPRPHETVAKISARHTKWYALKLSLFTNTARWQAGSTVRHIIDSGWEMCQDLCAFDIIYWSNIRAWIDFTAKKEKGLRHKSCNRQSAFVIIVKREVGL